MELTYNKLQFEVTRRCNQRCAHCCRGESENVDLTRETIDNFFNKNNIVEITDLMFSGGEPTLNGQIIEYICSEIIKRKINIYRFIFSINGLSYSDEMIKGINNLRDYILKKDPDRLSVGCLFITQDQFHKSANKDVVKKLKNLPYFSRVNKFTLPSEDILPYGRALENNLTEVKQDLTSLTDTLKNMKLIDYNGIESLYIYYQYIAANGNVINDGCQEYSRMDEYKLGNVNESSIEEIYKKQLSLKK